MKTTPNTVVSPRGKDAFTLLELLVVICVVVLGAAFLAPALARTRTYNPAVQCQYNAKQIATAWIMYSEDNGDSLVPNHDGATAGTSPSTPSWVAAWLDFTSRTDNTNTDKLVNHDLYPYGAYLGAYLGRNPSFFKCPSDHSTAPMAGGSQPRVRSISMNGYTGTGSRTWTTPSRYTLWRKLSQIRSPVSLFVTLDEHPGTINDGWFATDPDILYQLIKYPAAYHGYAGSFSFADGHSEIHKWRDPRTCPPFQQGQFLPLNVNLPGDPDLLWLAQHAAGVASYP
jgi:prepilin-type N-terminal cleavage/methylation domain-containing protein